MKRNLIHQNKNKIIIIDECHYNIPNNFLKAIQKMYEDFKINLPKKTVPTQEQKVEDFLK